LHITSALEEGEIYLGDTTHGTDWIGDLVGPRADLNAVAKRKDICPRRESNPDPPSRSLVTMLTALLRLSVI